MSSDMQQCAGYHGEPFEEKMKRLTATLSQQFAESAKLEKEIRKNLASLGFPLEDKS